MSLYLKSWVLSDKFLKMSSHINVASYVTSQTFQTIQAQHHPQFQGSGRFIKPFFRKILIIIEKCFLVLSSLKLQHQNESRSYAHCQFKYAVCTGLTSKETKTSAKTKQDTPEATSKRNLPIFVIYDHVSLRGLKFQMHQIIRQQLNHGCLAKYVTQTYFVFQKFGISRK